jgi:hypothetical protein
MTKLYLTCPNCFERLPQIGNEPVTPGDGVTCGLCGHVWKLSRRDLGLPENCEHPATDVVSGNATSECMIRIAPRPFSITTIKQTK